MAKLGFEAPYEINFFTIHDGGQYSFPTIRYGIYENTLFFSLVYVFIITSFLFHS